MRQAAVACHAYNPYGIISLGVTAQIPTLQKDWEWLGSQEEGGGGWRTRCLQLKVRQAAGRDFSVIKAAGSEH